MARARAPGPPPGAPQSGATAGPLEFVWIKLVGRPWPVAGRWRAPAKWANKKAPRGNLHKNARRNGAESIEAAREPPGRPRRPRPVALWNSWRRQRANRPTGQEHKGTTTSEWRHWQQRQRQRQQQQPKNNNNKVTRRRLSFVRANSLKMAGGPPLKLGACKARAARVLINRTRRRARWLGRAQMSSPGGGQGRARAFLGSAGRGRAGARARRPASVSWPATGAGRGREHAGRRRDHDDYCHCFDWAARLFMRPANGQHKQVPPAPGSGPGPINER